MAEAVDLIRTLFGVSARLLFVFGALSLSYQLLLALVGLLNNRASTRISETPVKPRTRFAVVVAARDEARVLPLLLQSLKAQDYPAELFDVFVIADNCRDATAAVARRGGAKVFERFDPARRTKGFALEWFFERQLKRGALPHDCCVVFDADNAVAPDFLKIMDRHVQRGARAAVGYRDSKNPSESAVAAANSLFWLHQTRLLHQARTNLGLPLTSLSGTGFMFAMDLIRAEGWHTETLTEDTEFTIQLILKGETPVLVREARFYDEQTGRFREMLRQRWRWSVGTTQTMRLMVPRLLARILRGELKLLDTLWFLLQVPFFALLTFSSALKTVLLLPFNNADLLAFLWKAGGLAAGYALLVAAVCLLLRLEGKKRADYARGIGVYPLFCLIWGGLQVLALFKRTTDWKPIAHRHPRLLSSKNRPLD